MVLWIVINRQAQLASADFFYIAPILSLRGCAFSFYGRGNLDSIFEGVGGPLRDYPPKRQKYKTKRTKTIKAIATLPSVARNDGMRNGVFAKECLCLLRLRQSRF